MNKNMGNHKRKGPHHGQMQNRGKGEKEIQHGDRDRDLNKEKDIHRVSPSDEHKKSRESEIHRAEHSAEQNVNREKEMPRTESWTTEKKQQEQKIHPVESSSEKIQPREKETHRMVSWNKEHREREISQVETAKENKVMSEVEIQEAKSQAAKNTDSVDGYDATVRARTYNQDPISQPSPGYTSPMDQSQRSRVEDIRSAPGMGTVLYTVAALLVIGWVIGFFFYDSGDLIHVLLVLALFAVLIRVAQVKSEESV